MIRALLFDLDGTLVDAADLHYEALNRALEESGAPGIGRPEHEAVFNGLSTAMKLRMLQESGRLLPEKRSWVAGLKQKYTIELARAHIKPDPVKVEMMKELRKDYKLAVVSNCVRASVSMLLDLSDLNGYSSFFVSNQDVLRPKPDGDPYRLAFKMLVESMVPAPKKSEVLVIEDNDKGVQSAQAAGLEVVQLQYPYITLEVIRAVIVASEMQAVAG